MMCRVAHRYGKLPFEPEFQKQWNNFEQRILLEASLEIDFDIDIVARSVTEMLPKLLIDLADIVGTNIFNALVSKKYQKKHLVKKENAKSPKQEGSKTIIPGIGAINIVNNKD